ncbi:MAG: hypothetical protein ACRECI_04120 [Methyloceanibacter sp.]
MNACTATSAIQLLGAALTFLLMVLWLETVWVGIAEDLRDGDLAAAFRKRSWLNAFVALGAVGAAILLLFWVSACTTGAI